MMLSKRYAWAWLLGCLALIGLVLDSRGQTLAAVQLDGKWGVIDTMGRWVVSPQFDSIEIDPYRRPPRWNGVDWRSFAERNYPQRSFLQGGARVKVKKHWGVVDPTGKLLLPAQFDTIESLASAYARNQQLIEVYRVGIADKSGKLKWGLISTRGEIKLYYDFDRIEPFQNGLAWVRKGKKWGQVNARGEMVVPFQLESKGSPENFYKGYAIVEQGGKKALITQRGRIVMPFEYDDLNYPLEGYILFQQAGRWGVADDSGRVRLPAQWEAIEYQTGGYFRVQQNRLWGLAHVDRQLVLPPRYERVRYTGRQLIWAFQNGFWGAFGLDGQPRQDFKIDYFEPCPEGNYLVQRNSRWGLVSDEGYLVQDYVHQRLDCAEGGYAHIRRDQKLGLIDVRGRLIIPTQYDSIQPPVQATIWVRTDERWGAFDTSGQLVHPARFERQFAAGGVLGLVREQGRYGLIDYRTGQQLAECQFESYDTLPGRRLRLNGRDFDLLYDTTGSLIFGSQWGKVQALGPRTDLYAIRQGGLWGLVDSAGRQLTPFRYAAIRYDSRSRRYLPVQQGENWGILDLKTASLAVPAAYREVHLIDEQYAAGQAQGRWQVVSLQTGLSAFEGQYDRIGELRHGLLAVQRAGRWGLVDLTGAERVPASYGDVYPLTANWIAVRSPHEDRWGLLDAKGKLVLRMEIEKVPELREGYIWFWFKGQERIIDPLGRYDLAVARPLRYGRIAVWKDPNWQLVLPPSSPQPAKPLLFRQLLPFYDVNATPADPVPW